MEVKSDAEGIDDQNDGQPDMAGNVMAMTFQTFFFYLFLLIIRTISSFLSRVADETLHWSRPGHLGTRTSYLLEDRSPRPDPQTPPSPSSSASPRYPSPRTPDEPPPVAHGSSLGSMLDAQHSSRTRRPVEE
jgi:hypothetical protein